MERLWTGDVQMKYPKQWIVMVNLDYDKQTHKSMGEVHFVTPDADEAYEKAIALGDNMGKITVFKGFDDTPQIGGLELWDNR